MNPLEAIVALNLTPMLGPIKLQSLIKAFGSALSVMEQTPAALQSVKGISPSIAEGIFQSRTSGLWKREIEKAHQEGVDIIPYNDSRYPKQLLVLPDYPALLYVKGSLLPEDKRSIAVVGTRNATHYGLLMAEKFSLEIATQGFTIVSGLARGVDTAAHRAALVKGRTLAVVGSGLSCLYPKENQSLAKEISLRGAVISEFSMQTPPDRYNFPRRNRIVSALSESILLIEAPLRSGALITMQKGLEQKKELFAIPGRADTDAFGGNHLWIRERKARLVESPKELMACLGHSISVPQERESCVSMDADEKKVVEQLKGSEQGIDTLCLATGFSPMRLQTLLMGLMMKKVVRELPGKLYVQAVKY